MKNLKEGVKSTASTLIEEMSKSVDNASPRVNNSFSLEVVGDVLHLEEDLLPYMKTTTKGSITKNRKSVKKMENTSTKSVDRTKDSFLDMMEHDHELHLDEQHYPEEYEYNEEQHRLVLINQAKDVLNFNNLIDTNFKKSNFIQRAIINHLHGGFTKSELRSILDCLSIPTQSKESNITCENHKFRLSHFVLNFECKSHSIVST